MASNWIGIDLGTYNSSAAIKSRHGSLDIIKSNGVNSKLNISFIDQDENCKEFPSFISFNKDGSVSDVGMAGKEMTFTDPEFVVWGVKRLLGKTYTELKESGELDRFPYRIRPNRQNGQCLIVMGEKKYTPEQLCAEIFKKIKKDAESQIEEKIDSVVVSVPAYYDPLRVTPIVEAARLANFVNVKTIPEPVAAALAYNVDITVRPSKVLVFDLGAGTLDVTTGCLYRQTDQKNEFNFQVIKNTGDPKLGGIDMDDRLSKLINEKYQVADDSIASKAILRRLAEIAKIKLSEDSKIAHIKLYGKIYPYSLSQFDLKSALEGTGFEKNLLEECRRQIMAAIDEAGWSPQDIELLIMIGGPTKLSCIKDVLKIIFNSNPVILKQLEDFYTNNAKVDRMTAVSIGAALSVERRVDDIVPHGHGVENVEFSAEHIIYRPNILVPRDSTYPFKSNPFAISWINLHGLFEFKIIQHVPHSEVKQLGYEYKFVGVQKFAVKNPLLCMVAVQMGYNSNKELEVTIKNILSNESVTYVGINQSTSIGMNYPLTIRKPSNIGSPPPKKIPSPEILNKFFNWVEVTIGFVQRKVYNYSIPQMLISQNIDEIRLLLKRNNPKSCYEMVYTKINGLIWNSNSRGLFTQNENNELMNGLSEFEGDLF